MTGKIEKGDWVEYRVEKTTVMRKVLEIRPDEVLIVGEHDRDPDPDHVQLEEATKVDEAAENEPHDGLGEHERYDHPECNCLSSRGDFEGEMCGVPRPEPRSSKNQRCTKPPGHDGPHSMCSLVYHPAFIWED